MARRKSVDVRFCYKQPQFTVCIQASGNLPDARLAPRLGRDGHSFYNSLFALGWILFLHTCLQGKDRKQVKFMLHSVNYQDGPPVNKFNEVGPSAGCTANLTSMFFSMSAINQISGLCQAGASTVSGGFKGRSISSITASTGKKQSLLFIVAQRTIQKNR